MNEKSHDLISFYSYLSGAPTVAELKAMKKEAADANVEICSEYPLQQSLCIIIFRIETEMS